MSYLILFLILAGSLLLSPSTYAGPKALVLIDMQKYWLTYRGFHREPHNIAKYAEVKFHQIEMMKAAIAQNIPIFVVETTNSRMDYGSTDPELIEAIGKYEKAYFIKKQGDSLFSKENPSSETVVLILKKLNISDLIFMGANGSVCVKFTIKDALELGFKSWAYTKGIADFVYSNDYLSPYYLKQEMAGSPWLESFLKLGFEEKDNIEDILPIKP